MEKAISFNDIKNFEKDFNNSRNLLAQNAVVANGINAVAKNHRAKVNNPYAFSVEVDAGKVTNQKQSGRCWMFASYNVMRLEVIKKLDLGHFELSQNYPLFFDKLEKSNYFLENIIDNIEEENGSRLMAFLLAAPVGDGGQWDMFRSLVEKYGVVPQDIMPESAASSATRELNSYLTKKLRGFACELRKMYRQGHSVEELRTAKEEMMNTVYRMLSIALGTPPEKFTWETKDRNGKYIKISDITPKEFFEKYVGWDLDEYVTVINAPTKDKPYGKTFTVKCLGNVKGGKYPVKYLNLPMDDLRNLTIKQLKDGKAVWFGSDVGQFSDRKEGFLTMDAFDLKGLFD
ncbi:MAG: C1 family peptidase, partial [Clostridia bacterium]|nr:C1 family peptidase [Clostridia bacterium]